MPNLKVMSEEEFIWDFLTKTFPNDHPIIYLFSCGGERTSDDAVNKALRICREVFDPVYPLQYLKDGIIVFLEFKKYQYITGKIEIKSFYAGFQRKLF